eukprot:gene46924-62817_t
MQLAHHEAELRVHARDDLLAGNGGRFGFVEAMPGVAAFHFDVADPELAAVPPQRAAIRQLPAAARIEIRTVEKNGIRAARYDVGFELEAIGLGVAKIS